MELGWVYFHFPAISAMEAEVVGSLRTPPVSALFLTASLSS